MTLHVQNPLIFELATQLRRDGFQGDIGEDLTARAGMATDNSPYQILPDIILAPLDAADVQRALQTLAQPAFSSLSITGRGGGTGTNGQALNRGVIIDFRRHMNRILEVNEQEGWVDVEPGIVLETLNTELTPSGLFFAPTTSTANRCTIGGMIGTDAAGKGSWRYGKTSDNVIGLEVMLADGQILSSIGGAPIPQSLATKLSSACDKDRAALLENVPQLPRRFTGYDLERARPNAQTLDWWRLIIGAESTLGLVTRARLKLTPKPTHNHLLIIAFYNLDLALKATQAVLAHNPLAIEVMDEVTQSAARNGGLLDGLPEAIANHNAGNSVMVFVEFSANSLDELRVATGGLQAAAPGLEGYASQYLATNKAEIAKLWSIRAGAVGLLSRTTDNKRPVSGIEDCAVPPRNLPGFVAALKALMASHNLNCGLYGHADVGCVHLRPLIDLDRDKARDLYAKLSDEVYALCKKFGGIFWGEHGKGVRGQYLRQTVGDTAYQAFIDIKKAFDPDNRLNPGKLVSADDALMDIRHTPFRTPELEQSPFHNAYACNGNAQCLSVTPTTVMCPSFKATGDLRHSPKGRAEAVKTWHALRQSAPDAARQMEKSLFEALDGCLGCKACASACPVKVDVPELKSLFLDHYFKTANRPLSDWAVMALEAAAPWLNHFVTPLAFTQKLGLVGLAARLLGLTDVPQISTLSWTSIAPTASAKNLARLGKSDKAVIVVPDPFTALFDRAALQSICRGLRVLGYTPFLAPILVGGKSAHVKGARKLFLSLAARAKQQLETLAQYGLPLIGADPAAVLMLRSEYAKAGITDLPVLQLVDEFLAARIAAGDQWPKFASEQATLLRHCTEQSALGPSDKNWQTIFSALGLEVQTPQTGCCGMAGTYGHEAKHQKESKALFDLSWRAQLEQPGKIAATGFSCRCQTKRLTGQKLPHPMQLIAELSS